MTASTIIWWPMCRWASSSRRGWIRVRSRPWPARSRGGCIPSPWDFRNYGVAAVTKPPTPPEIAARYNTIHQTQWISREDFQRDYRHILDVMDQPATDGVNMYFVAKAAAAAGMKTALSGLGGDELLGGYRQFPRHPPNGPDLLSGPAFPRIGPDVSHRYRPVAEAGHFAEICRVAGVWRQLRRGLLAAARAIYAVGIAGGLDPDMARAGWEELQPLVRLEETIPESAGGFSEGFGLGNGMVYAESTPAGGRLGRDGPFLGNPGAAGGYRAVEKDRAPARLELSPGETGHGRDAGDPLARCRPAARQIRFFCAGATLVGRRPLPAGSGNRDHDWRAWARLVYRHHTGTS